jgi:membrane-associated PAP2 superfamily phosphatase
MVVVQGTHRKKAMAFIAVGVASAHLIMGVICRDGIKVCKVAVATQADDSSLERWQNLE